VNCTLKAGVLFCCTWGYLCAGNLHFAHLQSSDMQQNKVYKCNVHNPYLDTMIGGSYTRLRITPCMYYITDTDVRIVHIFAKC